MNLRNRKGAILIITYMVFFVLLAMASGFALNNFSELFFSRRYLGSAEAFWLAEAGISRFLKNQAMLEGQSSTRFSFGHGVVQLKKDDSDILKRIVTSTGNIGGIQKSIQIEFAANPPEILNNSVSVNGDISIEGQKASFNILDRTRLSGKVKDQSKNSTVLWEDKKEGFNPQKLQVVYPDEDGNGTTNEFGDFVNYYRNLITTYPREEVIYVQGNGAYTFTPDQSLNDKKIIYIEGHEDKGDVLIQLNGTWKKGQKLTVISTGTVTFNQGGVIPQDSQLNIVAWSGYHETSVLPSQYRGIIYTHGQARFDNILENSITSGCVIAQGGMSFGEIWSTKIFQYADVRQEGILPLGFQARETESRGYSQTVQGWKEI